MSSETKKFDAKRLHMLVVLALIIIFHFLPPFGEMTPEGMQIFGIFLAGLYGWIFVDLLLPSIVCLVAISTTDAITLTQFFLNGIGSQTFVMVVGILFLTVYIEQTDLSNVIVNWIMSCKVSIGRPYVCLLLFMIACFAVATVSMALVALVLFIPLYRSLAKQANIPAYSKMSAVYFVGLGLAACMGEICLPFKPFILIVLGMLGSLEISIASLTMFLFPSTLLVIGLYVVLCKFILRIDASAYSISDLSGFAANPSKKQICGLLSIVILLIALLLPSFMPADFFLNRLGGGGTVLAILAIMMLVYIEGEPLMDLRAVGKKFNWDIFFNCAYFVPMGSLLTSDVTGIKPTISTIFGPVLANLSPYVFILTVVALVVILTNFLNNAVVSMLFISFAIVLGDSIVGVNVSALVMLIVMASFFSLATPAANAAVALLFAQKDLIDAKSLMKQAIITCIFLVIVTVTILYAYAAMLF